MATDIPSHSREIPEPDRLRLLKVRDWLYEAAEGERAFQEHMVRLVRKAIDEVIDTARSGRFEFDELDSTEKAYIGVRVEILFRSQFSLERGSMDVRIAGEDVDIKNTTRSDWMIPTHSVDKMCLLVRSNLRDDPGHCSMGLIVAREEYLNAGANQDRKRTISSANRDKILWLFEHSPYPSNVLESVPLAERRSMLELKSGAQRVAQLFTLVQRRPVPRHVVEGVARQTDAAKRVRLNGGARDLTEPDGVYIFSHDQQRTWIERLGLPETFKGDYISIAPETDVERGIIADFLNERGNHMSSDNDG